jgi:hypothetical protein
VTISSRCEIGEIPQEMMDTSPERLRLLVEQLEMIRGLLDGGSGVDAKVAIILLDNVADSLMYRRCLQEFEEDSELAMIRRPRFTLAKQSEALRDFKAKVNLLNGIGFMSAEDATVLKIGHSYRNAAYHRDSHNPRVTNELGRLLFGSVSSLFRSYYNNGVSSGGFAPEQGLSKYGLRNDFMSFKGASASIASKLMEGIAITFAEAQEAFQHDVTSRVEEIEREITKLPISGDVDLDEGLRRAEFSESYPHEQFSEKLRELNYRIVAGEAEPVDAKQYRAAQKSANRKMEKELTKFVPVCSAKLLKTLKSITTLKQVKNVSALLYAYQDLDSKLTQFEDSVEQLAIVFDRLIQREIDIRRGK